MTGSIRYFIIVVLVMMAVFIISGCESSQVLSTITTKSESAYGPRWTDYRDWGHVAVGMTKDQIIELLGEPYLPKEGFLQPGGNIEILLFKIRPKFYRVRQNDFKLDVSGFTNGQVRPLNASSKGKEVYPEKSAETEVWGELVDLYCRFQAGKLIEYSCPALDQRIDSRQESRESINQVPIK